MKQIFKQHAFKISVIVLLIILGSVESSNPRWVLTEINSLHAFRKYELSLGNDVLVIVNRRRILTNKKRLVLTFIFANNEASRLYWCYFTDSKQVRSNSPDAYKVFEYLMKIGIFNRVEGLPDSIQSTIWSVLDNKPEIKARFI